MAKAAKQTAVENDEPMDEDFHSIVELEGNLSDYEDYQPLPGRAYAAQVTEAELRTKESTGNSYFYVVLTIPVEKFPKDYDPANAPEGARLIYARLQKPTTTNRRSMTAMKNWYRTLGLTLKTARINPDEWVGRWVKVTVKVAKYNGEPINEIVSIEKAEQEA